MIEAGADVCGPYRPFVYGGWLDQWTYVQPGAWRGDAWPCPGEFTSAGMHVTCTCPCHVEGGLQHELPTHAHHTAVHPTTVLAQEGP